MRKITRQSTAIAFFGLCCLVWLIVTFPCVHMQQLYNRHHLFGSIGAHPELFTAYLRRAIWATTAVSVLGPVFLWLIPARFKKEREAVLLWGAGIGVAAAIIVWAIMVPAFQAVSDKPLGAGTFLYSGVLAGVIAAEINRRTVSNHAGILRNHSELKRDFLVGSLMTWAVVLKAVECAFLVSTPPGKVAVGFHFIMFLSVLLWSPWVCRIFWNHRPGGLLISIIRSSAAGVLFPPLVAVALYVPVMMLFVAGLLLPYAMLWGGIVFLHISPGLLHVLAFFPGLIWGLIVGILRWRYLLLEEQMEARSVAYSE